MNPRQPLKRREGAKSGRRNLRDERETGTTFLRSFSEGAFLLPCERAWLCRKLCVVER
jgi:hypothetical protein